MCVCLPMGLLRFSINLSAIITVIMSLICFGLTVFGFANKEIWGDNGNTRNMILYIMLGTSVGLLIMGLSGIAGAMKKNVCLLGIFTLGTFVFLLIFAGIGIIAFIFPNNVFP